jgi:phosphatidate cytidylyltransferase
MLVRIASAVVLVPLVVALVVYAPPLALLAALGAVGTLALREYFALAARMGVRPQSWFGGAAFWLLLAGLHYRVAPSELLVAALIAAALVAAMGRDLPMRDRALGMMSTVAGVLYLALSLYPAVRLRFDFGDRLGLAWLSVLLATVWAGDTAALLVGKTIGRTLFAPLLSPKKTNEGAVGGLAGGIAAAAAVERFLFPELPLLHVVTASLVVGMMAQLGDLAESMLKRAADTKDSSGLIPGHGGVLDRIDSLLFAIPTLYLYVLFLYGR